MTTKELYCKGAKIWVPHIEHVWEEASIVEDYTHQELKIEFTDGRTKELKIKKDEDLPPLRNPEILIGENDLTSLSYLHEPAVLHNLKYRFSSLCTIYTYCGIVLVAINPYDELQIYDNDTIWMYRGKNQGDLDPHIFAVAEEAYTKIERENRDQSIIVSGESGAGKTVSAKYVMRYFATVGGSSQETQVEKKVLSSSPIMEAIGNAKTTRNDNSSRFGKFIEIKFNKNYNIIGASMRTYLLEKSRVVFQAPDERNYHIFYQLCAARELLPHLFLDHQDKFIYLNQGESPDIDGVDDFEQYHETVQAFNMLGFTKLEQDEIFKVLAAILHLGNVNIVEIEEGCAIKKNEPNLEIFCKLLNVDYEEMRKWLCTRRIVSMKEVFNKPMTCHEAISGKEALSKHIYSQLFGWIVLVINKALNTSRDKNERRFIGVLDIYGFETFEINSFEQFCINYANEKLQQQFNQHVFKLEQEEYLKEEIEWKMIDFYDNQPCIDLIETRLGILDLLDEECRMPKGTDGTWAEKLYQSCIKYKHFAKPRFGNVSFIIHHFADNVEYQAVGFLDKNRDSVSEEQINALQSSQNEFLQKLLLDHDRKGSLPQQSKSRVTLSKSTGSGKQTKKTVGSQFRDSLNMLMTTLNDTTPHYVRCIKPNDEKKPFDYNPQRAVQQLRACGVLETIRISAAGFPSRWQYFDFFNRYRALCKFGDINKSDMKLTCQKVLMNNIQEEDKYQYGKSKIFFRAGQVAFLEKLRADRLKFCCILIQKYCRGFVAKKKYQKLKHSILNIQAYARGFLARKKAQNLRETKAAIKIQKCVRGWIKRKQYKRLQATAIGIQAHARGFLLRKEYKILRENHYATIIQKHVRCFLAKRQVKNEVKKIIMVQNLIRSFLARRQLKELKNEARTVEYVKNLNKGLENKIISLQQKLDETVKENSSLKTLQNEVIELRKKSDLLKALETDLRKLEINIVESELEKHEISVKLQEEQNEKMELLEEKNRLNKHFEDLQAENTNLKEQIINLEEKLKSDIIALEEHLKQKNENENKMLTQELDQQLQNHQQLVIEYTALEQVNEQLHNTIQRLANTKDKSYSSSLAAEIDDCGYASVRSTNSSTTLSSQESEPSPREYFNMQNLPEIDVGLVLKLQQKLKDVERERDQLFLRVESLEKEESPSEETARTIDTIKLTELEMENEKLKNDLSTLRQSLAMGDPGTKALLDQFRTSELELSRRTEEIVQLRAVLATQTRGLKNIAKINYGSSSDVNLDVINEDGELVMAFEAQKRINRQLEDELQHEKSSRKQETEDLRNEIVKLKEDNERQQKLLSINLNKSPQNQSEAYMQHEISRLTTENLQLQEKVDASQELQRKLRKQIRILLKKIRDLGIQINIEPSDSTETASAASTLPLKCRSESQLPTIKMKKERKYQGMFEYRMEDEGTIVRRLVFELHPRLAMQLLPGLPAYIFFMCIRHTDLINDDTKVRSLLTSFINAVKKIIKKKHDDLETSALWLSNTLRVLHNLKQYSGDKIFQAENTPTQNEQCLKNFDLSQYRQVLSDMAVWMYQGVIRDLQEKIQPVIVSSVLEPEGYGGEESDRYLRATISAPSLTAQAAAAIQPQKQLSQIEKLVRELLGFHKILAVFGLDPEVMVQLFRQLYYFIGASSLNNLLLRKDLCHFSGGLQIRYNISYLEQFVRDQNLNTNGIVMEALQPIVQASQLLQARKTPEDVNTVCEMCDKLTLQQIVKLLHYYTPRFEGEDRVTTTFIKDVKQKLQEMRGNSPTTIANLDAGQLLLNTKLVFPVKFPFNPSNVRLEDIEIPESLNLPMLNKV